MIFFTKYANDKFDILNKHKVYFIKEQIEDVVKTPETTKKKGKYFFVTKDGIKVVYKIEGEIIKVITFYPIK